MRLASIVLLSLALPGCGKFQRQHECTKLAERVNAFVGAGKTAPAPNYAAPKQAAEESRLLARRYHELYRELGELGVTSAELAPHVESYRKLAEQAGRSLEGAALALEKQDLELARSHRNDFDKAARSERPLVEAINDACAK